MKNSFKKLCLLTTAINIITVASAQAYYSPDTLNRLDYVIEASIQNPNMASVYSQNFLGTEPNFTLNAIAGTGDKQALRQALINSITAPKPVNQVVNQPQSMYPGAAAATAPADTLIVDPKAIGTVSDTTSYTLGSAGFMGMSNVAWMGIGLAGIAGISAAVGGGGGDGIGSGGRGGLPPFVLTPGLSCDGTDTIYTNCPEIGSPGDFRTTEFTNNYDSEEEPIKAGIKPEYAYARGITGKGIKIGIIDRFSNDVFYDPEIYGRIDHENSHLVEGGDDEDHGDWVAKFAAGAKNETGSHGLAYEASLVLQSNGSGTSFTERVTNMKDAGAKVINMSFGYVDGSGKMLTSEPSFVPPALIVARDNDIVMVASAGNSCNPSAYDPNCVNPGYPARSAPSAAAGGVLLAVGSAHYNGSTYEIADYSNRAGDAMNFYVMVPASWGTSSAAPTAAGAAALIRQAWPYLEAPEVVQLILTTATDLGAVGVDTTYGHGLMNLKEIFNPTSTNMMGNSGIGYSAYSSFIQPSRVFGDAFRRSSEEGGATVSTLASFDRVFETGMNAFASSTARQKTTNHMNSLERMAYKGINREINGDGFSVNFVEYVNTSFDSSKETNDVENSVATKATFAANNDTNLVFGYGGEAGAALADDYYTSGKSGLIKPQANFVPYLDMYDYEPGYAGVQTKFSEDDAFSLTFVYGREKEDKMTAPLEEARSMAAIANYNKSIFDKKFEIGFTNGFLYEDGTLLGAKTAGGLALEDGAQTMFTGMNLKMNMTDELSFNVGGFKGITNAQPAVNSVYTKFDNIQTESYNAGVESKNNFVKGDGLFFSFYQGLRVNNGSAKGTFFGQDPNTGAYNRNQFIQDLSSEGKETTIQALYNIPVDEKVDVSVAAQNTQNPNNVADSKDERAFLGKVRIDLN